MAQENLPLFNRANQKPWGWILLCGTFGFVAAVTLSSQASSSAYVAPTSTRSAVVAPITVGNFRQRAGAEVLNMAAEVPAEGLQELEASDFSQEQGTTVSSGVVGLVAVASALFGAAAMKMWGQEATPVVAPVDVEACPAAGASPMTFRTSAPWMGSSMDAYDNRGSRLILQAAKGGKGKGGGAKGKVAGIIKLALPAGKATPAPPVGPALGQYGLNIVAFCKEYNAATEKDAADGMIIPVEITAFEDRSYTFVLKTPPASVLLKKAAGIPRGSATPNKEKVGSITMAQLEEIAKIKLPDLNTTDVQKAMKIVEGTAKNMGVTIKA